MLRPSFQSLTLVPFVYGYKSSVVVVGPQIPVSASTSPQPPDYTTIISPRLPFGIITDPANKILDSSYSKGPANQVLCVICSTVWQLEPHPSISYFVMLGWVAGAGFESLSCIRLPPGSLSQVMFLFCSQLSDGFLYT